MKTHAACMLCAAALVLTITTPASAQRTGQLPRGTLQLVADPPSTTLLEVGQQVDVRLRGSYRDLPSDVRLYVILTPLRGRAMLFAEDESLTAEAGTVESCGNFRAADASRFSIPRDNFPINASIDMEQVIDVLMRTMPPEQLAQEREKAKGKKLTLTFAFVSSLGGGAGDFTGSVRFTLPDLGYHYDGLLITPYFFRFASDGSQCATFDGKRMNSVKYRVNANRPAPVARAPRPQAVPPTGEVSLVSYQAPPMGVGSPTTVQLRARFTDLGPSSQIYVALQAVRGDTVIATGVRSQFGQMSLTTCEDLTFEGGDFAIPKADKPLYATVPFLGPIEAALVGDVPRGGSGELDGAVRFTPPPLPTYYDGVRMIPVIFQWNDEGKRCANFDTAKMRPVTVRMTGR